MRKTIIFTALATSLGLAFAAQAHDYRNSSNERAVERTEYKSGDRSDDQYKSGYRSHDERREHRDRVSRSHDESREHGEARRHRDRDDVR